MEFVDWIIFPEDRRLAGVPTVFDTDDVVAARADKPVIGGAILGHGSGVVVVSRAA